MNSVSKAKVENCEIMLFYIGGLVPINTLLLMTSSTSGKMLRKFDLTTSIIYLLPRGC